MNSSFSQIYCEFGKPIDRTNLSTPFENPIHTHMAFESMPLSTNSNGNSSKKYELPHLIHYKTHTHSGSVSKSDI